MSDAVPHDAGPEDAARRSFHWRDLVAAGARFRRFGDELAAADYGGAEEAERARRLGLADLSTLPRTGFKGPRLADWMAAQGHPLGPESNRAYRLGAGSLAARLAPGEVVVLGSLDGADKATAQLDAAWSYETSGVWPVPRRDASFWFVVVGELSPGMFAKICGVDLRPKAFGDGHIAQTSVARTNSLVIRQNIGATLAYHLLGDSASAGYAWRCLLDAMAEFQGEPVGLDALLELSP